MPFRELGADDLLRKVLVTGRLEVANDATLVSRSRHVIVVIGTPVDEHLNPTYYAIRRFSQTLLPHSRNGQCVILRSTVYPGTTEKVHELLQGAGLDVHVAFCPERVAEGHALRELRELPQLVSGIGDQAIAMTEALFGRIAKSVIHVSPLEAELAKIFANS
jgi:UDP-N-acetyl-D-mannosaminuronic acid dehydrogenase